MNLALRVGAFVLAIGLVVGALAIRAGREGGELTDAPDGGGGSVAAQDVGLVCPSDLVSLCDALGQADEELRLTKRATAAQAEEWTAGDGEGAWLVPAAWADLVDDARSRAGRPALVRSEVVASTPLLLVVWADRAAVLGARCGVPVTELTWGCVGEQADQRWPDIGGDVRWGRVVPGHAAPDTTLGLQATAAVVSARLGTGFSLADLREAGFASWFRGVERAVADFAPPGGSHVVAMVSRGPSVADVAVASEAELTRIAGREVVFGELLTLPAEPLLAVELVVVGTDADAVGDAFDSLSGGAARGAFGAQGWRVDGLAPPDTTLDALPAAAPSPSGGALTAMLSIWRELVG